MHVEGFKLECDSHEQRMRFAHAHSPKHHECMHGGRMHAGHGPLTLDRSQSMTRSLATALLASLLAGASAEQDATHATCEPWCGDNDQHQKWCKCRACPFSRFRLGEGEECTFSEVKQCKPKEANDLPFESCSKWCTEKFMDSHCNMCACKECPFCVASASSHVRDACISRAHV